VARERRGGVQVQHQETLVSRALLNLSASASFPNLAARSAAATLLLPIPGLALQGSASAHGELLGKVEVGRQMRADGGGGGVLRRGRLPVLRPLVGLRWQWLQRVYCGAPFR
jgi:hypothetical protein